MLIFFVNLRSLKFSFSTYSSTFFSYKLYIHMKHYHKQKQSYYIVCSLLVNKLYTQQCLSFFSEETVYPQKIYNKMNKRINVISVFIQSDIELANYSLHWPPNNSNRLKPTPNALAKQRSTTKQRHSPYQREKKKRKRKIESM